MVDFDRLITRSTSHLGLLPSGEKRKPLLSIVFTTPSVHLVGDRNVALNCFAIWLADHQRPTPAASCDFLCGMNRFAEELLMETQGHDAGRLLHATVASFRV